MVQGEEAQWAPLREPRATLRSLPLPAGDSGRCPAGEPLGPRADQASLGEPLSWTRIRGAARGREAAAGCGLPPTRGAPSGLSGVPLPGRSSQGPGETHGPAPRPRRCPPTAQGRPPGHKERHGPGWAPARLRGENTDRPSEDSCPGHGLPTPRHRPPAAATAAPSRSRTGPWPPSTTRTVFREGQ